MEPIGEEESVARRVSKRRAKRRWTSMVLARPHDDTIGDSDVKSPSLIRSTSRRRLLPSSASVVNASNADVDIIKENLGDYQHHGTGNPLAVRSPSTPRDLAVQNLAEIIRKGVLGHAASADSTPKLKTERGAVGSFWTNRVRLAGAYGWTGLILPKAVDTSKPFPVVEHAVWFLVENDEELDKLRFLVQESDSGRWRAVESRVVTVKQLAGRFKEHTRSW